MDFLFFASNGEDCSTITLHKVDLTSWTASKSPQWSSYVTWTGGDCTSSFLLWNNLLVATVPTYSGGIWYGDGQSGVPPTVVSLVALGIPNSPAVSVNESMPGSVLLEWTLPSDVGAAPIGLYLLWEVAAIQTPITLSCIRPMISE
jgi:hypothetical protein